MRWVSLSLGFKYWANMELQLWDQVSGVGLNRWEWLVDWAGRCEHVIIKYRSVTDLSAHNDCYQSVNLCAQLKCHCSSSFSQDSTKLWLILSSRAGALFTRSMLNFLKFQPFLPEEWNTSLENYFTSCIGRAEWVQVTLILLKSLLN